MALVGADAERATAVRRGSRLAQTVDGLKVDVSIKSVTPLGVELATSSGRTGVFLPGSFTPLAAPTNPPPEFLSYLESEKVPIGGLMRLVSDQAGVNISVSDAASKNTVSIFLRNVTADAAVEEICRATGLWFRREPNGSVIRIMTMDEYSDNLNTFREESTEMFTLLYPNVIEVASVIYGLYPDRTLISLGEEEFDEDDEYDLSRRFRRFRVLDDNGGSQFMSLEAPQTTSTGSRSGSGNFSFSRGGATSRLTQWDQLRQRNRQRNRLGGDQVPLGADDARLMEGAYRGHLLHGKHLRLALPQEQHARGPHERRAGDGRNPQPREEARRSHADGAHGGESTGDRRHRRLHGRVQLFVQPRGQGLRRSELRWEARAQHARWISWL